MTEGKPPSPPKHKYPPLYEKIIPVALVVIAVAVVALLIIIVAVFLGLPPFTR